MSRNSLKRVSFKRSDHIKLADTATDLDTTGLTSLSPRGAIIYMNSSQNNSQKFEKKTKKKTYALKRMVWRIFMFFSLLITLLLTTYTLVGLLYMKQKEWVTWAFDQAVFLNIDIMA